MKNNAKDEFYHIGRAAQMLNDLYDLNIDIRKVREAGTRIINNASPIRSATFMFRAFIENHTVQLPCKVATIISVTGREATDQWFNTLGSRNTLLRKFVYTTDRIETAIGNPNDPDGFQNLADLEPIYEDQREVLLQLPSEIQSLSTPFAYYEPFVLNENVLSFNKKSGQVDILYSTVTTDEFGFPLITEKGIWAVVHYLVYIDQAKRFYKKEGNANAVQHAKEEYERSVAQARSPNHITDNQRNELMQALTSKYRHQFGNPYKG
jgi:hypothetical protein